MPLPTGLAMAHFGHAEPGSHVLASMSVLAACGASGGALDGGSESGSGRGPSRRGPGRRHRLHQPDLLTRDAVRRERHYLQQSHWDTAGRRDGRPRLGASRKETRRRNIHRDFRERRRSSWFQRPGTLTCLGKVRGNRAYVERRNQRDRPLGGDRGAGSRRHEDSHHDGERLT